MRPIRRRESLRVGQILRTQGGPQDDATYWRLILLWPGLGRLDYQTIVILSAAKNLADASGAAETWPSRRRESFRVGQFLRAQGGPQDDATYWRLNLLRPVLRMIHRF